jgi:integrase
MAKQLTALAVDNLKPTEKRREVPDGKIGGLFMIVQPSGAKSWALRYRIAGRPRKFTIGAYPKVDLATARKGAQEAAGDIAGGIDPASRKRASRLAQIAANSTARNIETITGSFVQKHLAKKTKPSWAKEAERLLRVEIVGKWGKRNLAEITRTDVRRLLDDIAERAPITANRTLAVFRKLCNWAVSQQLILASPCTGIEAPSDEHSRERVLGDDEIRLAWRAFDQVGWPFGPIGKLLLLTGARRDEVAGMHWAEIDFAKRTWMLPRERTKNSRPHAIPLCDAAIRVLESVPRIGDGKGGLVFTSTGATAVSGFSRAKAAIDAAMVRIRREDAKVRGDDPETIPAQEKWVLHDLRRTVATNLQKLGVRLEVTEAVLNHVSGSRAGIVGVYQRHEYSAEKRAALDAWARYLDVIVSGLRAGNIVALSAARG